MANQVPDCIFVQTDPAFEIVLGSLTELHDQGRLQIQHFQTAELVNIKSNDDSDDRMFMFGGDRQRGPVAFGRTASAVVRMCMLEATKIKRSFWPSMGPNSERRNKEALVFTRVFPENGQDFSLTNNRNAALRYWSKYDQLYPHFLIEESVSGQIGQQVSMNSMMHIFRNNFSQLVEITTNFDATPMEDKMFNSYVHVTCIVREIRNVQGTEDGEYTRQLKAVMVPAAIPDSYFARMKDTKEAVKEDKELDFVSDYFKKLAVD